MTRPAEPNPLSGNPFALNRITPKSNAPVGEVPQANDPSSIPLASQEQTREYAAVDIINSLSAAQAHGNLKRELRKYLRPQLLQIDELGSLPIDKRGADLLFQVISGRYEHGAIVITSNRAYKHWPEIFNNDSTLTSALLDRLLHHAETVLIEGKSHRMKDNDEA